MGYDCWHSGISLAAGIKGGQKRPEATGAKEAAGTGWIASTTQRVKEVCLTSRPTGEKLQDKTLPQVGIVMGSDSDLPVMEQAADVLRQFGVPFEITVASAHRSPRRAADYAGSARKRGLKVIIAGAGHAAHLAGVLAAHTSLPVIGVPIDSSCLLGLDSLLATVQMPPGIPVATVAIGKPGARNAGVLAVQMLAVSNPDLADRLEAFKRDMADGVEKKAQKVEQQFKA
jgi:phosphoribosylamine--glycine ligase